MCLIQTFFQIRLDFLSFSLSQPNGEGICAFDSFVVTGAASAIPVICGENSGQHMYLMVAGTDPIQLTITMSALVSLTRNFAIKVTQIACDCPTQGNVLYYLEFFRKKVLSKNSYKSDFFFGVLSYNFSHIFYL